jgi:hypothetical protein
MAKQYTVLRDTREKDGFGWKFNPSVWCLGTEERKLDTGDYTLEGLEDRFVIERKADTSEFSKNVMEARFVRELERLNDYDYPFIVLEFSMQDILDFPANSKIPPYKWSRLKVTNQMMLAKLMEFQVKFRARWILAGAGNGHRVASCLMKRIAEKINVKPRRKPRDDS